MQNIIVTTFQADANYVPGTLVVLGGDRQISATTKDYDTRVLGVVLSGSLDDTQVVTNGVTKCQVIGPVVKGDMLVSSRLSGVAQKMVAANYVPGCIIGKSLENVGNSISVIDVIVGVQ